VNAAPPPAKPALIVTGGETVTYGKLLKRRLRDGHRTGSRAGGGP
jgi:hypothetical protein